MSSSIDWKPTSSIAVLQARAKILAIIRGFFASRNVLEVETPIISRFGVTDPHINTIPVLLNAHEQYYLQTSPEYGMKRLLAAGSGAIYQLTKAFRGGDFGKEHNPEFTMLEWYRPGFDHFQLMTEVDELLQAVLHTKPAQLVTYKDLFQLYLNINPHVVTLGQLQDLAKNSNFNFSAVFTEEATIDDWLQALFAYYIEPQLTGETPWFVYNYPASQAALAKLKQEQDITVAERFEIYVQGLELANGYHELTEAKQQLHRFEQDQQIRAKLNKPAMAIDFRLIAALGSGLPACAGIALGVDRLVMLVVGADNIQQVIAFPVDRA